MSRDDSSVSCDARAIGALVVRSPRCAAPRAKPCFAGPEVGAYSGARDYLYQTCLCLPQRTDILTLIASQAVFEMEVIAFTGAFPTGPESCSARRWCSIIPCTASRYAPEAAPHS